MKYRKPLPSPTISPVADSELHLPRGGARHAERNAAETRATMSEERAVVLNAWNVFEGITNDAAKNLNDRASKSRPTVA